MFSQRSLWFVFALLALAGACSDDPPPGESESESESDLGSGDSDQDTVSNDVAEPPDLPTPDSSAPDAAETDGGDGDPVAIDGQAALELVDPFIGSGGVGFGYAALTPAAQAPFGLVKLGPDTSVRGVAVNFTHFSGYHFDDPDLRGFSHTHFIGTGVADYGNLRVLPLRDLGDSEPGAWWTRLDKDSEQASPGFYTVDLPTEEVMTELAASPRAGIHRYSFRGDDPAHLIFDVAAAVSEGTVHDTSLEITTDGIEGWVVYGGSYTGRSQPYTVAFSATLEPAADTVGAWDEDGFDGSADSASGVISGGVFGWDEAPSTPVVLRVGVSFVDVEQARANRAAEVDGSTLEQVRDATRALWAEKLGGVQVAGLDDRTARMFYTALYNVYRMPTRLDGVDGRYTGLDGEIHEVDGHAYYTDLSLWDTFRTLHPWLTLTDPDAQRDCLLSLLAMYDQGGKVPRWPAAISYTGGMIGTSADMLFAGSALKGIDGIDYDHALDALLASLPQMRSGWDDYSSLGYVPDDQHGNSVSKTLEYAWADFALANLADLLDRPEADALRERAGSYANVYHEDSAFFRPRRADGTFDTSVDVRNLSMGSGSYTEGTAWHWRFYAIHEGAEFAELMGGGEALGEALEMFFDRSALGDEGPVTTLWPDDYYWHGNEPTIHSAYLFHEAGRYDRLAHWVREIQLRLYGDGPDGIPGNDDGGTMSSWYLFSALGFYPIAGSDRYALGTPLVPHAEVALGGGAILTIEAEGASDEVRLVERVLLNGEPVEGGYLRHADLIDATLTFEMAAP